jgi:hypothetical protein
LFGDAPLGRIATMASKQPRKRKPRPRSGSVVNYETPVWEPLLGLARIYVDEFMWMHEVELDNGTRLQAYKHYWTRRYLHLDAEGNAWIYRGDHRYQQLVDDVLPHFNRIVLWRCAGQHQEEEEEWLAEYEERSGDQPAT